MFGLSKREQNPDRLEQARLDALSGFQILDTEREDEFDALAHLAAGLFRTPMALVSLVAHDRQWFKARIGVDTMETPRAISFCTHTIKSDSVLVIPDAREDPRFADNPFVTGPPYVRFYAGAPLITAEGYRLGSLCIVDTSPRVGLPKRDCNMMIYLAKLVVKQMESRLTGAY